jgi:endoglucanase
MHNIAKRSLRLSAFSLISTMSILGLVACGGGSSGGKSSSSSSEASSSVASSVATSSSSSSSSSVDNEGLTLLHADGAKWAKASGKAVNLKGTNLGNWLVQEFWMMGQGGNGVTDQCTLENKLTERFGYAEKERLIKLFRDSWMTERDWDQLQAFGFNIVRLPILWSVIEDEKNPKTLRADAWQYLDWAIAEGKKRGIYVILDLHGAQGGQTPNDHTGCAGQNKYWTSTEYQDRAKWLWEQIATKYKDEPAVAAYDPLNEPWGSTAEDMATRVTELYDTIRKIDAKHIVMLPSHYGNIEVYGDPVAKGMTNVAFELHPYPGLFGDRPMDTHYDIHRDWLRCGASGTGGVCDWNTKITALKTPFLMGEFQPWQSAGLELGGKVARATYDTYAGYGWASTSWAYKLVSATGGQGKGTWGMVTNAINSNNDSGVGLVAKASTWDCANWNSTFADACAKKATAIKVGGTGPKTYYFVIKTGANAGANPDVTYDKISIVNDATKAEVINNGNFGANTGWTTLTISGSEDLDFNFNGVGKTPVGSDGAVLRITRPVGVTGEINGGIYQAITLEGGQSYTFNGSFKDNGSVNTWAEMYLVDQVPVAGKDVLDMTGKVDFATAPLADIESLFKGFATQAYDVHSGLAKYLTTTPTTIYTLPKRPTGLKLVQGTGNVALNWTANNETDLTGYKIYRGITPGSGTLLAEGVKTNTYTDSTAVDGITYYYTVSATDAEDESYRSDEAANKINYTALPGKVEAEAYSSMSGIQLEDCSDTGGGKNVGYFEPDDYIEFKVSVATAGNFTIDYRLATANGSTGFEVLIDGAKVDAFVVPVTGGWQSWKTYTSPSFAMTTGNHTLRFKSVGKEWNINYFDVKAL